ncbi:MAG: DUF2264 domain-containing protein [Spirochaetota bacterium]
MTAKEELHLYLGKLLNPLLPLFRKNPLEPLRPGHGAHYSRDAERSEMVSRVLWGLAPAIRGLVPDTRLSASPPNISAQNFGLRQPADWLEIYSQIFRCGTDPKHPQYWGEITGNGPDQRYVEMCAMAYSFLIVEPHFWQMLEPRTQRHIFAWFAQINQNEGSVVDNNWRFFRIFVNAFFQKYQGPFNEKLYQKDIAAIDSMYLADGWYSDGHSNQRDYYIPMAMHFYALLYSSLIENRPLYIERAQIFARDFLAWFDQDGAALPFGRSLTYRFAQGAFWSAFILAGCCSEDSVSLTEAKGLLLRHLRSWLKRPIYDNAGVLTVGYHYPNLYMSESYNAVGSSYWAQKIFAILLLDESHPFWSCAEQALPIQKENPVQNCARMLFQRNQQGDVKCLNAGQWAGFEPNHTHEKYAKFSYSTLFGFNVSLQGEGLEAYAADSMLSFSADLKFWEHRAQTENHQVGTCGVASSYQPMGSVSVRTLLYPLNFAWHLRVHKIEVERELYFMEGSYCLPFDYLQQPSLIAIKIDQQNSSIQAVSEGKEIVSAVIALNYSGEGKLIQSRPNMNLLMPHSGIPVIIGKLAAGNHLILSLCGGDLLENYRSPFCTWHIEEGKITLECFAKQHVIALTDWGLT